LNVLSLIIRGTREMGLRALWDTFKYLFRKQWHRLRFGPRRSRVPAAQDYRRPGRVVGHLRRGQTVVVSCTQGSYALTVLAPDLVRVWFDPTADARSLPGVVRSAARDSYAIAKSDEEWPPCDLNVVETDTAIRIETSQLTCRVTRAAGVLTFLDLEGHVINQDAMGVGWHPSGPVVCRKRLQPDEHVYGLGERTLGLDLRGRRYGSWNTDPRTYKPGQDPIHLCIPLLLGLRDHGSQGYGIFFDNTFRGYFDLGATETDVLSFGVERGTMCYYFIYGPALSTVVERYTELTGRMHLPPRWVLGYHQSRWSYQPEVRVRKLARDFRQVYRVPCDCIHLDIHYMDRYRCFTWNAERFPDPAKKIADLHTMGFKIITIIDPGIRADHNYWVCQEGLERDAFCTYPDRETRFKGPVWPGDCYFPDFTDPDVRAWWGDLFKGLVGVGVDGIWNDMNEPAIFGLRSTTMPDFVRHDLDGRGGDHAEAHNVYGMQMARATVEGLKRLRPHERPVNITRSGWAGVQRYAMSWTGDNRSDWPNLWLSMPMLMNLGLSGLAHTGPDIGGYSRFATGELFTRWLQMGVFLPFLRAHTFVHSPDQEPWSWGEPYLSINRRYIELRYRLLPYLYTAFWQCAQTGSPIVRPLLLAFQDDLFTHTLDDQFMCGDAFLVAPVVECEGTNRSVYLPKGIWYDFWTDEPFVGLTRVEAEAPLERLPLFVRAGSVVPMGPVMQYVGEKQADILALHVYPGDGASELYEDDGHTWRFRDGVYRLTHLTLAAAAAPPARLELRRRTEGRYEPGYSEFEVVLHGVSRLPRTIDADGRTVGECERIRDGNAVRFRVGLFECLTVEWEGGW